MSINDKFKRTVLAARFALCLICVPFLAAADTPTEAQIDRIESYLNTLRTLEARFVQNNPDGGFAQGKLYLHRPGRMRFIYDPPVPLQLYADGNLLIHVDTELEQVSHYPLEETPAHFLLRADINFRKGLTVKRYEHANKVVRIELVDGKNSDIGSVILTFSDAPLQLRSWTITDAQGLRTELALVDARFGGQLDPGLFRFTDTFEGLGN
jgi:outer membrane lipoprotein-sorting protein